MTTFAENAVRFHKNLQLDQKLPFGIRVMNPFYENAGILSILQQFYTKFYSDKKLRKLIVGINPGRLGAGVTGIPFTDTKRLRDECGIAIETAETHEPSSVFIYDLIKAYGGCDKFYKDFYINSVCPLGFIRQNKKGNWVNCNYYDEKTLFKVLKPFIISSLKKQIAMGIDTSTCFVLGKKNAKFLKIINAEENLFGKIVAFDHPRYIVQYKSKEKDRYVSDYLEKLKRG